MRKPYKPFVYNQGPFCGLLLSGTQLADELIHAVRCVRLVRHALRVDEVLKGGLVVVVILVGILAC